VVTKTTPKIRTLIRELHINNIGDTEIQQILKNTFNIQITTQSIHSWAVPEYRKIRYKQNRATNK